MSIVITGGAWGCSRRVGRALLLALVAALAGCVTARHPLTAETDSTPDLALVGEWAPGIGGSERWTIALHPTIANALESVRSSTDAKGVPLVERRVVYTTVLDGVRYASVSEPGGLAPYTIYRYRIDGQWVNLRTLDVARVRRSIEAGLLEGTIPAVTGERPGLEITAPPAKLATFLQAGEISLWRGPAFEFARASARSPSVLAGRGDWIAGWERMREAARWIAQGEDPRESAFPMRLQMDRTWGRGTEADSGPREVRLAPRAYRTEFLFAGRWSQFLVVGDRSFMIRDGDRVTNLGASPTMKAVLPWLRRSWEVDLRMATFVTLAALDGRAVTFRLLEGVVDPRATGGAWFHVLRVAHGEPDMDLFFGRTVGPDGKERATAPERVLVAAHGDRPREEWLLQGWAGPESPQPGRPRFPRSVTMWTLGTQPEATETLAVRLRAFEYAR